MIQMLNNVMAIVSRTVHRQGRFLRRQVFDLALTLMIIGAGILLLLAAMIAGGMTVYEALRPVTGPAGALAIITLILSLSALVMGLTGYLIQAESDRRYGLNKADDKARTKKQDQRDPAHMTDEEAERDKQAYAAWLRTHRPQEGTASARFGLSEAQLAMARDAFELTQDQLAQKLDVVKRHPLASIGVAAGLGLLLGQSKTARTLARTATVLGGKYLMDHYLNDRPIQRPVDPRDRRR